MGTTTEVVLRYPAPSECVVGDGSLHLTLATAELAGQRPFFRGFLDEPLVSSTALLAVARIAGRRYYLHPSAKAALFAAMDPVITVAPDALRFEAFSGCNGVYARFDVDAEAFRGAQRRAGTTNIDVHPALRERLTGVTDDHPLHLQVGRDEVAVTTPDGQAVERRVPLPGRWVRGFGEVQLWQARMDLRVELDAAAARRFLSGLPTAPAYGPTTWAVAAGRTLRLTRRPTRDAVCLAGADRLRDVGDLVRFVRALRVYAPPRDGDAPTASAWELVLPGGSFFLVLSPDVSRGFSGEGHVLSSLGQAAVADAARLADAAEERGADVGDLAESFGLDVSRVRAALPVLAAAGRFGYDLRRACWFPRHLPFRTDLVGSGPRLSRARALVAAGAVRVVGASVLVRSGDVEHRVTAAGDHLSCTCPWYARYGAGRGPCAHVLARHLVLSAEGT